MALLAARKFQWLGLAAHHLPVCWAYTLREFLLPSRANTSSYVGAAVYVDDTRPRLALSDKSLRLVPHADVEPRWLQQALSAPAVRRQISHLATGTKDSMRNISQQALLTVMLAMVCPVGPARFVAVTR